MKTNSTKHVLRTWIEAAIVGLSVAIAAVVLQDTLGTAGWLVRLIALIGASIIVGLIQFIASSWGYPRSLNELSASPEPQESNDPPPR